MGAARHSRTGRRQGRGQGFVLVNALVIVGALSAIAVGVLHLAVDGVPRMELARAAAQGRLYSDAGVALARQALAQELAGAEIDHPGEPWALDGFAAEVPGSRLTVTVRDLSARLNLNLLLSETPEQPRLALQRLAAAAGLGPEVPRAIIDHLEPVRPAPAGVVDPARDTRFQAGDLTHPGQFAQVAGLSAAPALHAQLAALPRAQSINVNTADEAVLGAVTGLDRDDVLALIALRSREPFETPTAFRQAVAALAGPRAAAALPMTLLGVGSDWFEAEVALALGGLSFRTRCILHRDRGTGEVRVHARMTEVTG